jgi:quinol monooxygenase YgiN
MPALPWIRVSAVEPGTELTLMATRLPLRSYRHIPGFLRWTLRIRGQLASAPGLAGYSLDANLLRKTFWTVSAWTSQAAMDEFVRRDPHAAAMAAIRPHMEKPAFVFWTGTPEELPVRWNDVRERVGRRPPRRADNAPR